MTMATREAGAEEILAGAQEHETDALDTAGQAPAVRVGERRTGEDGEFRAAVRRFAEKEIAPNAAEADEKAEYPWRSFEAYRDSGLVRSIYPVEYGGDGGGSLVYALLIEEIARACASSSLFALIS